MDEISEKIISLIDRNLVQSATIELKGSPTVAHKRLVVSLPKSNYRGELNNALICRIKTGGKQEYVAFNSIYKKYFDDNGIETFTINSDKGFFRVSVDVFCGFNANEETLAAILNKIITSISPFSPFDCCSKYVECSDEKKCLHDDLFYSNACTYRPKLENGIIFYGKNRNV